MLNLLCVIAGGYLPVTLMLAVIVSAASPKTFRRCYVLYALAWGMIAYCYHPTYEMDISRYFLQMDYCRRLPFSEAFTWGNNGLIVTNFVFYLISMTNDYYILPLMSMSLVHGVYAYICADASKGTDLDIWKLLLFQAALIPFISTLSNVRNVSAFAMVVLAAYRDFVKGKKNLITIMLYILPCFIHIAGGVLVAFRVCVSLVKRYPYLGFASTLGIPAVSIAAFERFGRVSFKGSMGLILSRAIRKAYSSALNSSSYARSMNTSGYVRSCRAVIFVVCIVLLCLLVSQLVHHKTRYREYWIFCGLIIATTMLWISIGTVKYWVFAFAMIISCGPILIEFERDPSVTKLKRQCVNIIFVLAVCARFGLEVYYVSSRIDLNDYIGNFFTSNLWLIIGNVITGFLS